MTGMRLRKEWIGYGIPLGLFFIGCLWVFLHPGSNVPEWVPPEERQELPADTNGSTESTPVEVDMAMRPDTVFGDPPETIYRKPQVELLDIPPSPGAYACWGAIGRDAAGKIWIGISSKDVTPASAALFELDPESGTLNPRGDAIAQLENAGIARPGEEQVKIHTKPYPAPDGFLYFASTDESPVTTDGDLELPPFGSHLWRILPGQNSWEHLASVPEGVLSCNGGGRWVYFLAYPDHTLFQVDTANGRIRKLAIGSLPNHISRNFLCDRDGNAYVPRVQSGNPEGEPASAELVCISPEMEELEVLPMEHYGAENDTFSHGITAYSFLKDGSIAFATGTGFLYRLFPEPPEGSELAELGLLHDGMESRVNGLFSLDGENYLVGAAQVLGQKFQWFLFDLVSRNPTFFPLEIGASNGQYHRELTIYGSLTMDNFGAMYMGGRYRDQEGQEQPIVLKIVP